VRELIGGIDFGEHSLETDQASDSNTYQAEAIERVVRSAFDLAQKRQKKVTSIDKKNVLATSKLWRKLEDEVEKDYTDVTLEHQ
ncbi:isocitrate/isopropylmalate family dehydrogenase, partial [Streptococcus suis]